MAADCIGSDLTSDIGEMRMRKKRRGQQQEEELGVERGGNCPFCSRQK